MNDIKLKLFDHLVLEWQQGFERTAIRPGKLEAFEITPTFDSIFRSATMLESSR